MRQEIKDNKYLKYIFTAGFFFFLIKGLVWTAVAIWEIN